MPDIVATYKPKAGENWASLAFLLWDDEMLMSELIAANPLLSDTVVFEGHETVNVPDLSADVDKTHLPPWRQ